MINMNDKTLTELKALVYDNITQVKACQQSINLIEDEIFRRKSVEQDEKIKKLKKDKEDKNENLEKDETPNNGEENAK